MDFKSEYLFRLGGVKFLFLFYGFQNVDFDENDEVKLNGVNVQNMKGNYGIFDFTQ
ncbi:hypothetical protein CGK39_08460 [Vibrio parahaemolyticus]|nr:hypothetical protein D5E79_00335 [Vibrio parahaemolyticus]TNZ83937.1 hypothetical protein CGK39_08460 [Vibrio parahaemolyticus]TOC21322.1 hypothetical protein CGJ90_17555 [Vibrio parahaemolyticus]TPA00405.1 hypothetical protein DXE04_03025 [Vibrio parahaemolyticus]HAS6890199.1 hypothetical protein [Vibrio parahaemolyticus]